MALVSVGITDGTSGAGRSPSIGHGRDKERKVTSSAHPGFRVLRSLSILGAAALVALTFVGCDGDAPKEDADVANLPPARVDLPAVPADLGQSSIPEKHPDGSLTIDGLRRQRQKNLDQEVTVKGKVSFVYRCEFWVDKDKKKPVRRRRRKGEEEEGPPKMCERHHFVMVDVKGKPDNGLLVVGLDDHYQAKVEDALLNDGDILTVTGKYTDIGDGFVETERGLINVREIAELKPTEEELEKKKK